MPTAAIKFVQGLTVGLPGQALQGVAGSPVGFSNGDDTDAFDWTWVLYYAPAGSAVGAPGKVLAEGQVSSGTFTPDLPGGYVLDLAVKNRQGVKATDRKTFQVPEPSGRLIPPMGGNLSTLNFAGQQLGWSEYVDKVLRHADSVHTMNNAAGGNLADVATDDGSGIIAGVRFTAGPTLRGLAGGTHGRLLYVFAVGSAVTINNEDGVEATAANRVLTGTGAAATVGADGVALLAYDATSARWRMLGGGGGGGGGAPGGAAKDVQVNVAAAFGADTGNFTYDPTLHALTAGFGNTATGTAAAAFGTLSSASQYAEFAHGGNPSGGGHGVRWAHIGKAAAAGGGAQELRLGDSNPYAFVNASAYVIRITTVATQAAGAGLAYEEHLILAHDNGVGITPDSDVNLGDPAKTFLAAGYTLSIGFSGYTLLMTIDPGASNVACTAMVQVVAQPY